MSFLIPQQLVFNSSRHTALYLLTELYGVIKDRLNETTNDEVRLILSNLLHADPGSVKTIENNSEDPAVVRFIKFYLEFNHIAERFHRVYLAKEKHLVPKLITDFKNIRGRIEDKDFEKFLSDVQIDLVFTAHPTEIYERKILKKYIQIHKNLKVLKNLSNFAEKSQTTKERRALLLSLWLAADFSATRPKPKDEAKLAQLVFQYSLWDGITKFKKSFYSKLRKYQLPLSSNKNVLKFSSWIGGDRDGNPFVTAKVTADIIRSFSKKSLNLYFREFKRLKEDLCFEVVLENKTINLEKEIESIQNTISKIMDSGYDLDLILECEAGILDKLNEIYNALVLYKTKTLADRRLRSLIDRFEALGFLGMSWDIRQESSYHDIIVDELFFKKDPLSFSSMSEKQRREWLSQNKFEIKKTILEFDLLESLSAESKDFLETLFLIQRVGSKIIPFYIISMARSASDLALIQTFFDALDIKTQVVPLFETLEDLENSSEIMHDFLSEYLSDIKSYKNIPIMLGYSDSAKTGSQLASVWNLYLAQKKLVQVAQTFQVECQFFHGRGGSIGRGGGPVQHAVASCPIESISKGFRMTIQGEVIFDRFGFSSIAVQSMMTYVLSLINYKFSERKKPEDLKKYEDIFSELSEYSKVKYRSLISAEGFLDYFEKVTPVSFMGDLNIGSRPSKRQASKKSYRAIPWVFGWTQNRCLLPTWYGAGTALEKIIEKHGLETMKHHYDSFYLFRSNLDLIYMTYLKIDMDIFQRYDQVLAPEFNFKKDILKEYELLKKNLLLIVDLNKINHQNLEEKLYGRLEVLEYVHELQIRALDKSQKQSFNDQDKKILLLTIQALASGMGNTG